MFLLPLNDWKLSWTFPICHGSFEHVSRPFMVTQWGIKWKRGSLHPGIPAVVILGTRRPRPQSWPWHRPNTAAGHVGLLRLQKHADLSLGTIYPLLKVEQAPWVSCVVCSSQTQMSWNPEVQNHPCCINCTTDSTQPVIQSVVSLGLNIFIILQEKKEHKNTTCVLHTGQTVWTILKFEFEVVTRWPCTKTEYSGRGWHP